MASDNTNAIALTYAQALFDLAMESQTTDSVRQELGSLVACLEQAPDFTIFLESPSISSAEKLAAIGRIFEGKLTDLIMNFLQIVASRDRLGLLVEIQRCFTGLEDKRVGRVKGTLVTAVELSEKEVVRLTEQIARALRKTVSLNAQVDPSIIGGMVLTIEDTIMDGSIKKSLKRFSQQLRVETVQKLPVASDLIEQS